MVRVATLQKHAAPDDEKDFMRIGVPRIHRARLSWAQLRRTESQLAGFEIKPANFDAFHEYGRIGRFP
jgi:hypothetical protein